MRDSRRGYRFRRYHSEIRLLFITIPAEVHERLHTILFNKYRDELVRTNWGNSWIVKAATTFRPRGHPGGDGGEGDSAGGPRSRTRTTRSLAYNGHQGWRFGIVGRAAKRHAVVV